MKSKYFYVQDKFDKSFKAGLVLVQMKDYNNTYWFGFTNKVEELNNVIAVWKVKSK